MPSTDRPESGFLVLADLPGVTAFVTTPGRETGAGPCRGAGPGIIPAHRFLKKGGGPMTYGLVSGAGGGRLGRGPVAGGMAPFTGTYAHFGEVGCYGGSPDRFGRLGDGGNGEVL